tara:strand:- start:1938 stop:2513 length:576 start_codon:yes stop_codon:yes gene_type:complete
MFLESKISYLDKNGSIEVICGSMFSGKTEELIKRIKRLIIAKKKIAIFKPKIDKRYAKNKIVSHNKKSISAIEIKNSNEILNIVSNEDVVAIDEVQFFNTDLIKICIDLANSGKRVIVCGLDMDFLGKPFGIMPELLSISDHISKMHAICTNCRNIANFSFRKSNEKQLLKIGEKQDYQPLCRSCFYNKIV